MATIKLRRATAATATTNNPVLAEGEPGFETDTGKLKIGDGSTAWNSLPYVGAGISRLPWNFADHSDAFPTSADVLYIAEDDHGVFGDADYVPANTWFIANTSSPSTFAHFDYK